MEAYQRLEQEWAAFNDLDPVGMVACSSGTAALHLALESLQLPPGSKVLVPDFTMVACPRAVVLAGLEPVFVDCGDDLNMDSELKFKCGIVQMPRPNDVRCILAVHIYGRRVDMESWMSSPISAKVVEDLAEAHGVKPSKYTDAACWSFYRNKIVAGEEGGAVWFRDPKHAALARQLRSLGFTEAHDFNHVPRGHNYRMSNAHAELVLKSLEAFKFANMGRRLIERWYDDACPPTWRMPPRDAPWVYDLRLPSSGLLCFDRVIAALKKEGIAARHAFKPMHEQEEFRDCQLVKSSYYPRSSHFAACVMYLPIQPGITTQASVARAFSVLRDFFPE